MKKQVSLVFAAIALLVSAARLEGQHFFFSAERPTTCASADGIVTIVPTRGTPPFSYLWSNGSTDLSIRGVQKGVYSATLTDATGAVFSASHFLNSEALDVRLADYRPSSFCNPNSGLLEAEALAGVGPFSFAWSNGQTAQTATNLALGEFGVTVTDATGCTAEGAFSVGLPHGNYWPHAVAEAAAKPTCTAPTGGELTAAMLQSGYEPYAFEWSTGATTATLAGIGEGNYSVTVTDALGCSSTTTFSLQKGLKMTGSVVCTGQNIGTASAEMVGGTAPIQFLWATGATTSAISGLSTGYYEVTATDATGCTTVDGAQVFVPTMVPTDQSPDCFSGADGRASVWIQNDQAMTYSWSNGSTESWAEGLAVGQHGVTVTTALGCTLTGTVDIAPPLAPAFSITETVEAADCSLSKGGKMNLSISGGIAPYTFYASGPNGFFSSSAGSLQNLAGGKYFISAYTNAGFCSAWKEVTVPDAGGFNPTMTIVDLDCAALALGSAAVEGVTAPNVAYKWNNGATTPDIYALTAGCYDVTVTGDGDCLDHLRACIYGDKDSLQLPNACFGVASGRLLNDLGAAGCAGSLGIPRQVFRTEPSGALNLTDENGAFEIGVGQGPHSIRPAQFDPSDIACPPSGAFTVDLLPGQVASGLDFHFFNPSPVDHRVEQRPLRSAQPGYPFSIRTRVCNDGTTATAGTLGLTNAKFFGGTQASASDWFSKNAGAFSFASETVGAQEVVSIFDFSGISAGGCALLQTDFLTPTTTAAGTDFFLRAAVSPATGDPTPANNSTSLFTTVFGSFDPNAVYAMPARNGNPRDGGELLKSEDRTVLYQIFFQNTGSAPANTVIVRDTVDQDLDLATIRAIESSHEIKVKIAENRVLVFEFPNIHLPDSTADFANSIGSVSYQIDLKNGLATGTEIKKSASIYFDFNPPVVTNENVLRLVETVSSKNPGAEKEVALAVFPNPADQTFRFLAEKGGVLTVSNALGATVLEQKIEAGAQEIDSSELPSGVYFIRLAVGQTSKKGKLVVQH